MITICKWLLGTVLFLLALLTGSILAPAAFLALAFVVTAPGVLVIVAALVGGLVTGGLAYLLGRWFARKYRRHLSLGLGAGTALLLLTAAGVFLFRSRTFDEPKPADRAGVHFESLTTGSVLAVRIVHARAAQRRGGIIFAHGGPGADASTNDPFIAALSPLADAGFDVCLYDQIGSGLSARLDDPYGYTAERHVDDLEALRRHLGWDRPVLIGESWGAQLIARYASKYPHRISAAILVSPGPLRPTDWANRETGSVMDRITDTQAAAFDELLDARFVTAMLLFRINPRAAFRFLPQAEAEQYGSALLTVLSPGAVCNADVLSAHSKLSMNPWVGQMIRISLQNEPRDRLEGLESARFPVLVLRGDCDYGREGVAADYVNAFPRGELVSVADAGHFMLLESPAEFLQHVTRFLNAVEN